MKTSFDTLIKRISPKLRGITHRLNGHFTYFNDDDLYQEALGHLWTAYGEGTLNDKTDSYVLQGCYFHLKNYIRTATDKGVLVSMDAPRDDETALEDVLSRDDRTTEYAGDAALLEERLAALRLSGREREVFSLLLGGMTTREIGSRLGISHVMVVKIKGRIRDAVAAILKK